MYLSILKNAITEKGKTVKQAAESIGLTPSGFYAAVKNDTLKVKDLIKISNYLGVPLTSILRHEIEDQLGKETNYKNKEETEMKIERELLKKISELTNSLNQLNLRITTLEETAD